MEARVQRHREHVLGLAVAFHKPEDINELYPAPLPPAKVKWWGGEA